MIDSGTKDIHGNFIPESQTAILRNHLTPFWTLVDINEMEETDEKDFDFTELKNKLVNTCRNSQKKVINAIKNIEKDVIKGYRIDNTGRVWSFDQFKYHIMNKHYANLPMSNENYVTLFSKLQPIEIKIID